MALRYKTQKHNKISQNSFLQNIWTKSKTQWHLTKEKTNTYNKTESTCKVLYAPQGHHRKLSVLQTQFGQNQRSFEGRYAALFLLSTSVMCFVRHQTLWLFTVLMLKVTSWINLRHCDNQIWHSDLLWRHKCHEVWSQNYFLVSHKTRFELSCVLNVQ